MNLPGQNDLRWGHAVLLRQNTDGRVGTDDVISGRGVSTELDSLLLTVCLELGL